jgi:DNA-binding transcriptional ArsR family regulator
VESSVLSSPAVRGNRESQLDAIFHALGDRTRRALIAQLAKSPARITELAAPFSMSLPAVSRHIRVLEEAGLVRRRVDGRVHHCMLRAQSLREAARWLKHYQDFWEGSLESLAKFVEPRPAGPRR